MFKRRKKRKVHHHIRDALFPKKGWWRRATYFKKRTLRLSGTPHSIAVGFAFGVAISFTPFLGFHLIAAAALAWAFGGNVLASAIGTVIGNPWTFPLIWLATHEAGNAILGTGFNVASLTGDSHFFMNDFLAVLIPMTVGGVPYFIISWIISYYIMFYVVRRYQTLRRIKRAMKKKPIMARIRPEDVA